MVNCGFRVYYACYEKKIAESRAKYYINGYVFNLLQIISCLLTLLLMHFSFGTKLDNTYVSQPPSYDPYSYLQFREKIQKPWEKIEARIDPQPLFESNSQTQQKIDLSFDAVDYDGIFFASGGRTYGDRRQRPCQSQYHPFHQLISLASAQNLYA